MDENVPAILDYFEGISGAYVELSLDKDWNADWAMSSKYLNDDTCDCLKPLSDIFQDGWRYGSNKVRYGEQRKLIDNLMRHAADVETGGEPHSDWDAAIVAGVNRDLAAWIGRNPGKSDLLVIGY